MWGGGGGGRDNMDVEKLRVQNMSKMTRKRASCITVQYVINYCVIICLTVNISTHV